MKHLPKLTNEGSSSLDLTPDICLDFEKELVSQKIPFNAGVNNSLNTVSITHKLSFPLSVSVTPNM